MSNDSHLFRTREHDGSPAAPTMRRRAGGEPMQLYRGEHRTKVVQ